MFSIGLMFGVLHGGSLAFTSTIVIPLSMDYYHHTLIPILIISVSREVSDSIQMKQTTAIKITH